MSTLTNALVPLTIPTHDGSNQPNHPCVIDFYTEHSLATWAGYRYWMVMSPYPNGSDAHEDPNIVASADGKTWVVPEGMANPLDDAPGSSAGYNADPDMVYNSDTDQLWVYYRYYSATQDKLEMRLIKVNSDMSYTSPVAVITISPYTQETDYCRAQVVWRESVTRWHMWGNGGGLVSSNALKFWHSFSPDGINWGDFELVINESGADPFLSIGVQTWHAGGKPNNRECRMEFIICTRLDPALYYCQIPFDNPTLINMVPFSILRPHSGSWDNGLYRPTFTIEDTGYAYKYRVWYAGVASNGVWAIGYTDGYLDTYYTEPYSASSQQLVKVEGDWIAADAVYVKEDGDWIAMDSLQCKAN